MNLSNRRARGGRKATPETFSSHSIKQYVVAHSLLKHISVKLLSPATVDFGHILVDLPVYSRYGSAKLTKNIAVVIQLIHSHCYREVIFAEFIVC